MDYRKQTKDLLVSLPVLRAAKDPLREVAKLSERKLGECSTSPAITEAKEISSMHSPNSVRLRSLDAATFLTLATSLA